MIQAMETMVDELGATGMWADGFLSGYAYVDGNDGGYSYDRWDGHSVDIDPQTKLVTRKKTCVAWASLPVLKKVVQIIAAKGGVTITNEGPDYPMSRSFWKEDVIASCEGSPDSVVALHLGRAPCSLSSAAPTAEASYLDILAKLDRGVAVLLVPAQHGPQDAGRAHVPDRNRIDPRRHDSRPRSHRDEELRHVRLAGRSGTARRLSVRRPRVSCHATTSSARSTRTACGRRCDWRKNESAAVVKIPVTIQSPEPVNVNVRRYDVGGIDIALNGRGEARVRVTTGTFAVTPGVVYRITASSTQRVTAGEDATLEFTSRWPGRRH